MRGRVSSLALGALVTGAVALGLMLPGTAAAQHSRKLCPPLTPLELMLPYSHEVILASMRGQDRVAVALRADPCRRPPITRDTALQFSGPLGYGEEPVGFFRSGPRVFTPSPNTIARGRAPSILNLRYTVRRLTPPWRAAPPPLPPSPPLYRRS